VFECLLYVIDRTVWHSAYLSDREGTSAQYAHPCPLNRSSQNPLSCFRSRLLIIRTSSPRFCTRASLFANLGSFASSGSSNILSARILNWYHVRSRLLILGAILYLFVIPCTDHQISILAREYLIGHNRGVRRSMPSCFFSCNQIVGCDVRKPRYLRPRYTNSRATEIGGTPNEPASQIDYSQSIHLYPSAAAI
jgi:hypothetical protein